MSETFATAPVTIGYYMGCNDHIVNVTNEMNYGSYADTLRALTDMCRIKKQGVIMSSFERLVNKFIGTKKQYAVKDDNIEIAFIYNEDKHSIDIFVKGIKMPDYEKRYEHLSFPDHNLYKVYKFTVPGYDYKKLFPDYENIIDTVLKYREELNSYGNTTEWCPHCEQEVELKPELSIQGCPSCGKMIKGCSMCETKHCNQCPLGEDSIGVLN